MMVRGFAVALASTALAWTALPAAVQSLARPAVAMAAAGQVVAAAKPQYGAFGFDEAGMDRGVAPGDNFYRFANGDWLKNTPIPPDKPSFGAFEQLQDLSDARTHELLEAAKADRSSKIGMAYGAFLDTAAIETKGLAPINPWLNRIRSVTSKAGYATLAA